MDGVTTPPPWVTCSPGRPRRTLLSACFCLNRPSWICVVYSSAWPSTGRKNAKERDRTQTTNRTLGDNLETGRWIGPSTLLHPSLNTDGIHLAVPNQCRQAGKRTHTGFVNMGNALYFASNSPGGPAVSNTGGCVFLKTLNASPKNKPRSENHAFRAPTAFMWIFSLAVRANPFFPYLENSYSYLKAPRKCCLLWEALCPSS